MIDSGIKASDWAALRYDLVFFKLLSWNHGRVKNKKNVL